MITTQELTENYNYQILRKAACPVCLSALRHVPADNRRSDLVCGSCRNTFYVMDGLPILLLGDENWQKKSDEIDGEVQYNIKKIPLEVHIERNSFVDRNTELFLAETGVDLSGREILAVGCSMAELDFYSARSDRAVCLDIVPRLTKDCYRATMERNIKASWICGDGECLPLESESFDIVIVRQTLHHMLKYYSAISEFFRVCRLGGTVAIVDEPFSGFDPKDTIMSHHDQYPIYDNISLMHIKEHFGMVQHALKGGSLPPVELSNRTSEDSQKKAETKMDKRWLTKLEEEPSVTTNSVQSGKKPDFDMNEFEKDQLFIESDASDPETLLADKYHAFSLLNCIHAVRMHTDELALVWPKDIAWTDSSGDTIKFCHGPNPHYDEPLLKRLLAPGNVSIAAHKRRTTTCLRKREGLRSISLEILKTLL